MSFKKVLVALGIMALAGAAVLPLISTRAACSPNDVVNCGVSSRDALKNAIDTGDTTTKSAYQSFSVDKTEVDGAVDGVVTKSGQVIVGGSVIATNVWSAGRQFMNGSVAVGPVWMRPTSVSFASTQLDAFVYAPGGVFQWAVIKECGNPVKSISAPFGQIFKRVVNVTQDPANNYAADEEGTARPVATNDTVRYEITVTNNGTAPMTNVHITENPALPQGVELISNPAKRAFDIPAGTIAAGDRYIYTLTTRVTSSLINQMIDNQACFTGDSNQNGCDHAWIKVTAPTGSTTPPTTTDVRCVNLTKSEIGTSAYRFEVGSSLTNLTVVQFIWNIYDKNGTKIDSKTTGPNENHLDYTFKDKGDYSVAVQIKSSDNNTTAEVAACKVSFTAPGTTPPTNTPPTTTTNNNTTTTTAATTTPTRTPATGAESTLVGAFGTGALGYAIRAYRRSKRSLTDAVRGIAQR